MDSWHIWSRGNYIYALLFFVLFMFGDTRRNTQQKKAQNRMIFRRTAQNGKIFAERRTAQNGEPKSSAAVDLCPFLILCNLVFNTMLLPTNR